eukprot:1890321-Alexandrium_andersonii.AAC.1
MQEEQEGREEQDEQKPEQSNNSNNERVLSVGQRASDLSHVDRSESLMFPQALVKLYQRRRPR